MRIHEIIPNYDELIKRELVYEELPPPAKLPKSRAIFNVDDPDSKSMQSHKRRNTTAYQKMINWD